MEVKKSEEPADSTNIFLVVVGYYFLRRIVSYAETRDTLLAYAAIVYGGGDTVKCEYCGSPMRLVALLQKTGGVGVALHCEHCGNTIEVLKEDWR